MNDTQIEEWERRDKDKHLVKCIGTDSKQHVCYPWSKKCYCREDVLRKKYLRDDWKRFSCYECTY